MNRVKIVWLVLCIGVGLVSAYFGGKTALASWNYLKMDSSVPAKVNEWKVIPTSGGKYSIQAEFEYQIEGETLKGLTLFTDPLFLNPNAAILTIKDWGNGAWLAWYDSDNVGNSSLEKSFPLNLLFRFILSLGVFIYFFWVKRKIVNPFSS